MLKKYARKKSAGNAEQALAGGLARTIALYRQQKTKQALREVAGLLKQEPNDPFFWELKGDILRASTIGETTGKTTDKSAKKSFEGERQAQAAYRKALKIFKARQAKDGFIAYDLPIRFSLFDSLLVTGSLEEAAVVMQQGLARSPRSILVRRKLASLYERQGRHAERALVWAEALWLGGERKKAYCSAQEAIRQLPPGSPQRLRAEDLALQVRAQKKRREKLACS